MGLLSLAAFAAAAVFSSPAPAGTAATCTQAQKDTRAVAAVAFRKGMAAGRRAYFARVKAARKRAAFVQKQKAKLKALQAAAACTVVTPLPPSSDTSCAFELEPNREAVLNRPFLHSPMRHLGPIERDGFISASGRAEVVMIFVDFPEAPASEQAAELTRTYTAHLGWFEEASYGRFSVNVTVVPNWFRMPQPGRSYGSLQVFENGDRYLADALTAVGGAVDFSRYHSVWVIPSRDSRVFGSNYVRYPGRGVAIKGTEIQFAVLMGESRRGSPFESAHANHRFLASLGTSDLGESADNPPGHWDPNFADGTGAKTAHLLGWHKWMLRWLDPAQITCAHGPSSFEETLTPIAHAGGKKLVVVPTGPSTAYALEVRQKVGYDRAICRGGVLLYTIDSQVRSGEGPIQGKSSGTFCSPDATPFVVGESYEDANVKVEVLATDGSAYRVRVTKK